MTDDAHRDQETRLVLVGSTADVALTGLSLR